MKKYRVEYVGLNSSIVEYKEFKSRNSMNQYLRRNKFETYIIFRDKKIEITIKQCCITPLDLMQIQRDFEETYNRFILYILENDIYIFKYLHSYDEIKYALTKKINYSL